MTKVFLPQAKIKVGGTLNEIASNLTLYGQVEKTIQGDFIVYSTISQELFENVLNHVAIMLIIAQGGEIEGYLMYAQLPFAIGGVSIYEKEVPEGLQKRTMKVTDGTQIIEAVKKLGQWVNADLQQSFSEDFKIIYVETRPLAALLKGSELKIIVDGFEANLLTVKEFRALVTV